MMELEKQQYERLCEIGRELEDASFSGRLDFDAFKSLLWQAIDAVGANHSDLEMFGPYARGEGWWEWMTQELHQASSRHVA